MLLSSDELPASLLYGARRAAFTLSGGLTPIAGGPAAWPPPGDGPEVLRPYGDGLGVWPP